MFAGKSQTHPLQMAIESLRLSDSAYLRALPFVLDLEVRLRLEAIVFSADLISIAFVRMAELALQAGLAHTDKQTAAPPVPAIFQQVWSIVDQIHNLRQLFGGLEMLEPLNGIEDFLRFSETATLLRNKVDHLGSMIPNIAKSKGTKPGLFGSLSYTLVLPRDVHIQPDGTATVKAIYHVVQQTGPMLPNQSLANMKVRDSINTLASRFKLEAFDWEFEIDDAIVLLAPLICELNAKTEKALKRVISEKSRELGRTVEELSAHYGANYLFMLKCHPTE